MPKPNIIPIRHVKKITPRRLAEIQKEQASRVEIRDLGGGTFEIFYDGESLGTDSYDNTPEPTLPPASRH
jgi:hypothetical protein